MGVPFTLLALRVLSTQNPLETLAWDAGAVAILPSFAAGMGLACVSLLMWPSRLRPDEAPRLACRLLALRLPRDEASLAINTARLSRTLWRVLVSLSLHRNSSRSAHGHAVAAVFSPGFGLVASAAYGGLAIIVTNVFGSAIAQEAYGPFAFDRDDSGRHDASSVSVGDAAALRGCRARGPLRTLDARSVLR